MKPPNKKKSLYIWRLVFYDYDRKNEFNTEYYFLKYRDAQKMLKEKFNEIREDCDSKEIAERIIDDLEFDISKFRVR